MPEPTPPRSAVHRRCYPLVHDVAIEINDDRSCEVTIYTHGDNPCFAIQFPCIEAVMEWQEHIGGEIERSVAERRSQDDLQAKMKAIQDRLEPPSDCRSGSSHCSVATLPNAYRRGNNPWCDDSWYSCGYCGLELHGDEIGFVAAGPTYANGEHPKCPQCGEENSVYRGDED